MMLMWDRGKGSQRDKAGQQHNSYILWSHVYEDDYARRTEREVLLGDTAGAEAGGWWPTWSTSPHRATATLPLFASPFQNTIAASTNINRYYFRQHYYHHHHWNTNSTSTPTYFYCYWTIPFHDTILFFALRPLWSTLLNNTDQHYQIYSKTMKIRFQAKCLIMILATLSDIACQI